MNDRFAASLRRHLLETANERPADGQLAAVFERVADTPQRHPLVDRLARFPERIGPFPPALSWALIAAALLIAAAAMALLGSGRDGRFRSTVFEGTWSAIDPGDGSIQTLVVAAGMTPAVHFEDGFSYGGACVADDIKLFKADGTGQVSGTRLDVSFPDGGGCGKLTVDMGPGFYEYDAATDRLTASSDSLVWSRLPDLGALPVVISSLITDAPSGANTGTFESSGAATEGGLVCPGGVVTDLVEIDSGAVGRGELVDFTVPKEFACDDGSGTIAVTVEIHVDLEGGTESFSWVIDGGTGAYERLRGEGYGSTRSPATDRYLNTYWGSLRTEREPQEATSTLAPPPQSTRTPTPAPPVDPLCTDLTQGGTYTAPAGSISVTATIPSAPAIPWQGVRDFFYLTVRCDDGSPIGIGASMATTVNDGGCMPISTEISGFADAIARLDAPQGNDISERIDLTIDGHPAARYDISRLSSCSGFGLWSGTILGRGETGSIYVIDVDGELLAIELNRNGSQTAAELEEAYAIVASLQFAAGGAPG